MLQLELHTIELLFSLDSSDFGFVYAAHELISFPRRNTYQANIFSPSVRIVLCCCCCCCVCDWCDFELPIDLLCHNYLVLLQESREIAGNHHASIAMNGKFHFKNYKRSHGVLFMEKICTLKRLEVLTLIEKIAYFVAFDELLQAMQRAIEKSAVAFSGRLALANIK